MDNDQIGDANAPEAGVGIRITGLEESPAQFANLISTNFDESAFQVVFAQVLPPVVTMPEQKEQINQRGYLDAHAVARLVLTPLMVEQTIQNLSSALDGFRQRTAEGDLGESND